ncbi:MAG: aldo/keto reductase, partial [Ruthenibacterium sp.]
MQYRTLGKTGLRVSAVGLGGIPLQRIDAAEVAPMLHRLSQQGVNFIDTARAYTVSEDFLGRA